MLQLLSNKLMRSTIIKTKATLPLNPRSSQTQAGKTQTVILNEQVSNKTSEKYFTYLLYNSYHLKIM